ncbi:hypothetical protein D3C71_1004570 [compost metagenome]
MLLEPAAQFQRFDTFGLQLRICPAQLGINVYRSEQLLHPVRRDRSSVHGFATQARAVARRKAFIGVSEELDILRFRAACGAAWSAEDPGGLDRREEHPLVGGVSFEHGANHLGVGRQQRVL